MKNTERNCGMPYPIYPPYQGVNMMPGVPNMSTPYQMYPQTSYTNIAGDNTFEQQLTSLQQQVSMLDKRVSALEKGSMTSNNYSSSNYQMM